MDNASLRESFEVARQRGIDFIDAMNDVFAPDGLTYWDRQFKDDAEFLAWHLHQSTYPSPEFNTLYFLRQMAQSNPDVARMVAELDQRYQRAVTAHVMGTA